jgi:hypothetical protein
LWEILRYLPVSKAQLGLFRARRVGRICLPLSAVVLVLRNTFSLAFYHGISVYDVVIPLGANLLLPILICRLFFDKTKVKAAMIWKLKTKNDCNLPCLCVIVAK